MRRIRENPASWIAITDGESIEAVTASAVDELTAFDEWRGGCGLSLAVARRIIDGHNGALWSASKFSKSAVIASCHMLWRECRTSRHPRFEPLGSDCRRQADHTPRATGYFRMSTLPGESQPPALPARCRRASLRLRPSPREPAAELKGPQPSRSSWYWSFRAHWWIRLSASPPQPAPELPRYTHRLRITSSLIPRLLTEHPCLSDELTRLQALCHAIDWYNV